MLHLITLIALLGPVFGQQQFVNVEEYQQRQRSRNSPRHQLRQNTDSFNDFEALPTSTQAPKVDLKQLLQNPEFLEFFKEFQQQINETPVTSEQPTTTTTEQASYFPTYNPYIQASTKSPLFEQYFASTKKPKRQRVSTSTEPKRIRNKPNRVAKPETFEPIPSSFQTFVSSLQQNSKTERPLVELRSQFPKKSSPKPKPSLRPTDEYDEAVFRHQAENAKYEFASETDDTINGNFHQRQEVRDGLAVKGQYGYSDGYYKRTVHYEADDKGYRVVKEEVEPIGDGPQFNPGGSAKVSQYVAGSVSNYQITNDDIQGRPALKEDLEE